MPAPDSRLWNRLLLFAAATLFSTGGAAIKATTLTPWQVSSFRSAAASVALLALLPAARRGWSLRVIPVSIAYAATLVLYVLSTKLTTAANSIFLQSTAPIYLLLLSPFLLREPIRRRDLLFILAVALGMWLVFLGRDVTTLRATNPLLGNRLAALSGLTWAGTVGGLRWLGKGDSDESGSLAPVVLGNILAFGFCLPMALPAAVSLPNLVWLLYLGVFQIGLAYVCLTRAIRYVPAFEASALMLIEPAMNPAWTWLFHGERPSLGAIGGGAAILGATLVNAWFAAKPAGEPASGCQ